MGVLRFNHYGWNARACAAEFKWAATIGTDRRCEIATDGDLIEPARKPIVRSMRYGATAMSPKRRRRITRDNP